MTPLHTTTPEETTRLGERLAAQLLAGDTILLHGELGAGKTCLVRGIVRGLGSDDHVSSPTFVFIHEYSGPRPVAHIDLYRLAEGAGVDDLGIQEYLDGSFVTMVEWPDVADGFDWGPSIWDICISVPGETSRSFQIIPPSGRRLEL